jgi:hypothetical protein
MPSEAVRRAVSGKIGSGDGALTHFNEISYNSVQFNTNVSSRRLPNEHPQFADTEPVVLTARHKLDCSDSLPQRIRFSTHWFDLQEIPSQTVS